MEPSPRRVVAAGVTAALISGLPSTLWALITGATPLTATRAAGTLVPGKRTRPNLIGGVQDSALLPSISVSSVGVIRPSRLFLSCDNGRITSCSAWHSAARYGRNPVTRRRSPRLDTSSTGSPCVGRSEQSLLGFTRE